MLALQWDLSRKMEAVTNCFSPMRDISWRTKILSQGTDRNNWVPVLCLAINSTFITFVCIIKKVCHGWFSKFIIPDLSMDFFYFLNNSLSHVSIFFHQIKWFEKSIVVVTNLECWYFIIKRLLTKFTNIKCNILFSKPQFSWAFIYLIYVCHALAVVFIFRMYVSGQLNCLPQIIGFARNCTDSCLAQNMLWLTL